MFLLPTVTHVFFFLQDLGVEQNSFHPFDRSSSASSSASSSPRRSVVKRDIIGPDLSSTSSCVSVCVCWRGGVTSPLCASHRSVLSPTKAPRNVSSSLPRRCSSLRNAEEEEEEVEGGGGGGGGGSAQ